MAKRSLLTRRNFFGATLAGLAGSYVYARWVEPYWVEFVRRDLPIANLPTALEGRTLVQCSDLHVGRDVEDDYLVSAFRTAAEFEPDLVVVTGDYMTCRGDEQLDHTARILERLPRGRLATLGILGNHDYAHHYRRTDVADRLTTLLTGQGIAMLRNARTAVAGLTVVGLDDLWSPKFRPQEVLSRLDHRQPALVLCHNPDVADRPVWAGYRGWILCGHTHGGQCKPPLLAPPIVPVQNKRYIAGEVDLYDGRRLYINRGLGHIRHVRFNARPEVTVFTLRRQQTEGVAG